MVIRLSGVRSKTGKNTNKKKSENWRFWKSQFFELAILISFFLIFFSSSPCKSVKVYRVEWMGLNFDNCDGFQPKITHPKHFWPECSVSMLCHIFNPKKINLLMKWKTLILFCRILLIASQKPVIFICCKIGSHTCQIQSKRTTSKNLAVSSDGFLFRQMMKLSKRDFLTNIWVDLKITIQPVWVRIFSL